MHETGVHQLDSTHCDDNDGDDSDNDRDDKDDDYDDSSDNFDYGTDFDFSCATPSCCTRRMDISSPIRFHLPW